MPIKDLTMPTSSHVWLKLSVNDGGSKMTLARYQIAEDNQTWIYFPPVLPSLFRR